jgi:hypothetical protein
LQRGLQFLLQLTGVLKAYRQSYQAVTYPAGLSLSG